MTETEAALATALRLCVALLEQIRRDGLPRPDDLKRGEDAAFGFWNTYDSRLRAAHAALAETEK